MRRLGKFIVAAPVSCRRELGFPCPSGSLVYVLNLVLFLFIFCYHKLTSHYSWWWSWNFLLPNSLHESTVRNVADISHICNSHWRSVWFYARTIIQIFYILPNNFHCVLFWLNGWLMDYTLIGCFSPTFVPTVEIVLLWINTCSLSVWKIFGLVVFKIIKLGATELSMKWPVLLYKISGWALPPIYACNNMLIISPIRIRDILARVKQVIKTFRRVKMLGNLGKCGLVHLSLINYMHS